jgi:hypothetical protein
LGEGETATVLTEHKRQLLVEHFVEEKSQCVEELGSMAAMEKDQSLEEEISCSRYPELYPTNQLPFQLSVATI